MIDSLQKLCQYRPSVPDAIASHDLAEHLNQKLWLVEQQYKNNLSCVEMPKRITAGVTIKLYVKLRN